MLPGNLTCRLLYSPLQLNSGISHKALTHKCFVVLCAVLSFTMTSNEGLQQHVLLPKNNLNYTFTYCHDHAKVRRNKVSDTKINKKSALDYISTHLFVFFFFVCFFFISNFCSSYTTHLFVF